MGGGDNNGASADARTGQSTRGVLRRLGIAAIVILLVSCALEVFVYNFDFFASRGYHEVSLNDRLGLARDPDGSYLLSEDDHDLEFSGIDLEVRNVRFSFDEGQPAQLLEFQISFSDEAHESYFGTTDYTSGVPKVRVSTVSEQSCYVHLAPSGKVGSLLVALDGESARYPVRLSGLSLNAPEPFSFNFGRLAATFAIILLGYLFRPGSRLYRIGIVEEPRFTKCAIVAATCAEAVLLSAFLLFGSNLVGVATSFYNWGEWDGQNPVNTYEAGGDNAQQYAMLARSLSEGHLYLDEKPPAWLAQMDDPYDKGARDEMQKAQPETYLHDTAYYGGRYYVYFGVVPVLLFYVPFHLITGGDFPTAIGVLVALLAFLLGCTAMLDRFARYHFSRVSLGVFLLLQIPLVACCGSLYLAKFPTFYSLPIACALAFTVWGLYLWMRGRVSKRPAGWYAAGSLCMALVAGCRPQMLAVSLVAFPLFWRKYVSERRLFGRKGAGEFFCLAAPYVLVAACLMGYNFVRFGSVLDFGANYNLTVHDMPKRGLALGRIAPALFAYFLQPPAAAGTFPYLMAETFSTTFMGETVREATFGGILACLPFLWILPFARPILKLRFMQRSTNTIAGVTAVLLASGVVVALFDAELAGILQRYFADFSFMFCAAAVLLAFIVNENLDEASTASKLFKRTLSVLVAFSVAYAALLCFVPEIGWYSDVYAWAYQDIVEAFEFWT